MLTTTQRKSRNTFAHPHGPNSSTGWSKKGIVTEIGTNLLKSYKSVSWPFTSRTSFVFVFYLCLFSGVLRVESATATATCTPCPTSCKCKEVATGWGCKVDCSSQSLAALPSLLDLPTNVSEYILEKNELSSIGADAFSGLINVKIINLKKNRLTSVHHTAFLGLTKLEDLDLSDNDLQTLPNGIFTDLTAITSVALSKNPWLCNCDLMWLHMWLNEQIRISGLKLQSKGAARCTEPSKHSTKFLIEALQTQECASQSSDLPTGHYQSLASLGTTTPGYNRLTTQHQQPLEVATAASPVTVVVKRSSGQRRGKIPDRVWNLYCHKRRGITDLSCLGPGNFISCVYDRSLDEWIKVLYTKAQLQADIQLCREYCFTEGLQYALYSTKKACLCGEHTDSSRLTCSNSCDHAPANGRTFCGKIYLEDAFPIFINISLTAVHPLSTQVEKLFTVHTDFTNIDLYTWQFTDISDVIASTSGEISYTYFYPGDYVIGVTVHALSANDTGQFHVSVREPVQHDDLTCPQYVDVSEKLNVSVLVTAGYDVSSTWTRLSDGGKLVYGGVGCLSGWLRHRYKCLQGITSVLASTSAESHCNGLGGHLLEFDFEEEVAEVTTLLSISGSAAYFVGAEKNITTGLYRWMTNSTSTFFSSSTVLDAAAGTCVVLKQSGLAAVTCSTPHSFICEKEPVSCGYGGELGPDSKCYLLSTVDRSWAAARTDCSTIGDMAVVSDIGVHNYLIDILQSESISSAWLGLSDHYQEDYFTWVDGTPLTSFSPEFDADVGIGDCVAVHKISGTYTWLEQNCNDKLRYFCSYTMNDAIQVNVYSAGMAAFTGINLPMELSAPSSLPSSVASTSLWILPGFWFSVSGKLTSLEFIAAPQSMTTHVSLQVYRPVCTTGQYLVPPGCSGLLSPFATCSSSNPVCSSPTSLCSDRNTHPCLLIQSCLSIYEPCSCHGPSRAACGLSPTSRRRRQSDDGDAETGGNSTLSDTEDRYNQLDPRNKNKTNEGTVQKRSTVDFRFAADIPRYMLIANIVVEVQSSTDRKRYQVTDHSLDIKQGDVLGFEQPTGKDVVLCMTDIASEWSQSVLQSTETSWQSVGDTIDNALSFNWIDNIICYFRVKYTMPVSNPLPDSISYLPTPGTYTLFNTLSNSIDSKKSQCTLKAEERIESLSLISPAFISTSHLPSDVSGLVAVQYETDMLFTVKVAQGTDIRAEWSHQPGIYTSFHSDCPAEIASITECIDASDAIAHKPFSYTTVHFARNSAMSYLTITARNHVSMQTIKIKLDKAFRIELERIVLLNGLTVAAVGEESVLSVRTKVGSSIHFQWYVDGVLSHTVDTDSTFRYTFNTPTVYQILVNASNVLGYATAELNLTVIVPANFRNVRFLNLPAAIEKGKAINIELVGEVNIGCSFTKTITYGDNSSENTSYVSSIDNFKYVLDHAYITADLFIINITFSDTFSSLSINANLTVLNAIHNVTLSANATAISLDEWVLLTVLIDGTELGELNYTWNISPSATAPIQTLIPELLYSFSVPDTYNITALVSNLVSQRVVYAIIHVQDHISGLSLTYDGPKLNGSLNSFFVSVSTGSDITYTLDVGHGVMYTQTLQEFQHTFDLPGSQNVLVTASNLISQQTVNLLVFILSPVMLELVGIATPNCTVFGDVTSLNASVININPEHLLYFWQFGDGNSLNNTNLPTVLHTYLTMGSFIVNVTVTNSVKSKSVSTMACVQMPVVGLSVRNTEPIGLVGRSTVVGNLTAEVVSGSDIKYTWQEGSVISCHLCPTASVQITFSDTGSHIITVIASNDVSDQAINTTVVVQEIIDTLYIACSDCKDKVYLATGTRGLFVSRWMAGTDMNFTWTFINGYTASTRAAGYTFRSAGDYDIHLEARNLVSTQNATFTVTILDSVTGVTLTSNATDFAVESYVMFKVSVARGTAVSYKWHCCTTCPEIITIDNSLVYQFEHPGHFRLNVTISNAVSSITKSLDVYSLLEITNATLNNNIASSIEWLPVGEIVNFTVDLINDLRVEYIWTLTQHSRTLETGTASVFMVEFTGIGVYKISVTVSNLISSKTVIKTTNVLERINGFVVNANSTLVPENTAIRLHTIVSSGTDITYSWIVKLDSKVLLTSSDEAIVYTFTNFGTHSVQCNASNGLSSVVDSIAVMVQEPIDGAQINNFKNATMSVMAAGVQANFDAVTTLGSHLQYLWTIHDNAVPTLFTSKSCSVLIIVPGTYLIELSIYNNISSVQITHNLQVQTRISNLDIHSNVANLAVGDSVNLDAEVSSGDNIRFYWDFGDKVIEEGASNHTSHIYNIAGVYIIDVEAYNNISSYHDTITITVQEPIDRILVANCCTDAFPTNERIPFMATVSRGTDVLFNITLSKGTTVLKTVLNSVMHFTFSQPGLYQLRIAALNFVSTAEVSFKILVQNRIQVFEIISHPVKEYIFHNQEVTFEVSGVNFEDAEFDWNFSSLSGSVQTSSPGYQIVFTTVESIILIVMVHNKVSSQQITMQFNVQELQCNIPTLSNGGNTNRVVKKSQTVHLEVNIDAHRCSIYTAEHRWLIYRTSDCSRLPVDQVHIPNTIHSDNPEIIIPSGFLDYGEYCMKFTTGYLTTPVHEVVMIHVSVMWTDIVAVISGGEERTMPVSQAVHFDASLSFDPDLGVLNKRTAQQQGLFFAWTCTALSSVPASSSSRGTDGCFTNDEREVFLVDAGQFLAGWKYRIDLTVSTEGCKSGKADCRTGSTSLNLVVVSTEIPTISVTCLSCYATNNYRISANQHVTLIGQCTNCGTQQNIRYWWTVTRSDGILLQLNKTSTTTGGLASNLVIRRGQLMDNFAYTFLLEVVKYDSQMVELSRNTASLILLSNSPPKGGNCNIIFPSKIIALETMVEVQCTGWNDTDSPGDNIIYEISVERTNTVPPLEVKEKYLLYHGTNSQQKVLFSSWPGMDRQPITLVVRVIDSMGAAIVALRRNLMVENPIYNSPITSLADSKTEYIKMQAMPKVIELVRLKTRSALLQYAIAVTLALNDASLSAGPTADDLTLTSRAEIRDLIVRCISGLPLRSMEDIQQLAFALTEITKFSSEFQTSDCQSMIAESVETMTDRIKVSVLQGVDSEDFTPTQLLTTMSNLLRAINLPIYSPQEMSNMPSQSSSSGLDGLMQNKVIPENLFTEGVSTITSAKTEEQHRIDVVTKTVHTAEKIMSVILMTRVQNEEAVTVDLGDIQVEGSRTQPGMMWAEVYSTGCQFTFPQMIFNDLSSETEMFRIMFVNQQNPFTWGYKGDYKIGARVPTLAFKFSDGLPVSVKDVAKENRIKILIYLGDISNLSDMTRMGDTLIGTPLYDPHYKVDYHSIQLDQKQSKKALLNTASGTQYSSIHVQVLISILPNSTDEQQGIIPRGSLIAYFGKNMEPSEQNNIEAKIIQSADMAPGTDHRIYTFFLEAGSFDTEGQYYVTLKNADPYHKVNVTVGMYFSSCQYYNATLTSWDTAGCISDAESIPLSAVCLCNHLTSFGASVLVPPSSIDFADLADLDLVTNPVALITVCVILAVYIVCAIICYRLDRTDLQRYAMVPLCGKDAAFKYEVTVITGRRHGAGTTANVGIRLYGERGRSRCQHLCKSQAFQRSGYDNFLIAHHIQLGKLYKILVWHDNTGRSPSWYMEQVVVRDLQTGQKSIFLAHAWLSLNNEGGFLQKELYVTENYKLQRFSSTLKCAASHGFADGHLWLSVIDQSGNSRFTRVQRATACVTLLYTYMCVNAIWYGLLKRTDSDGNLLGWTWFSWEEVVVGIAAAFMVFPLNMLIVLLFRKSRCKRTMFDMYQKPGTPQIIEVDAYCGLSHDGSSLRTISIQDETAAGFFDTESTSDSIYNTACGLHRTHTFRLARDLSEGMLKTITEDSCSEQSTPRHKNSVPPLDTSGGRPWWSKDKILNHWPVMSVTHNSVAPAPASAISAATVTTLPKTRKQMARTGSSEDFESLLDELDPEHKQQQQQQRQQQPCVDERTQRSNSNPMQLESENIRNHAREWTLEEVDDENVWPTIKAEIFDDRLARRSLRSKNHPTSGPVGVAKISSVIPPAHIKVKRNGILPKKSHPPQGKEQHVNIRQDASLIAPESIDRKLSFANSCQQSETSFTSSKKENSQLSLESTFRKDSISKTLSIASSHRGSFGYRRLSQFSCHAHKGLCLLPHWCVYLAFSICFILCGTSVILVLLYGLYFGQSTSLKWLVALIISFVLSAFIIEPMKVLVVALFVALFTKSTDPDEYGDQFEIMPLIEQNEKLKDIRFRPLGGFALLRARESARRTQRMHVMIRQFLAYSFLLLLILGICYINYDNNLHQFTQSMRQEFVQKHDGSQTGSFHTIDSFESFWNWSEQVLVHTLHQHEMGVETGVNTIMLGSTRLRQIRSVFEPCSSSPANSPVSYAKSKKCPGAIDFTEDTQNYGKSWNHTITDNITWSYSTAHELDSSSVWGLIATYSSGGYVQLIGSTLNDTLASLADLKSSHWLDKRSRAVLIEFAVYNAALDITTIATLILELSLTGKAVTSYNLQTHHLLWYKDGQVNAMLVCQVLLAVVGLYYFCHLLVSLRHHGRSLFTQTWALAELIIITLLFTTIGLYVKCMVLTGEVIHRYSSSKQAFTDFRHVADLHDALKYTSAWLLFVILLKVVKQLRFIHCLAAYEKTLVNAARLLMGAAFILLVLMLIYAQLGYLMFGQVMSSFHSFPAALLSVFGLMRGNISLQTLIMVHPVFAHFYVYTFYGLVIVIATRLLTVVILNAYRMTVKQMYFKCTLDMQDYEMIEFMLRRFKLWAGIMKPKPAFRHVKFQGLPSVSSQSTFSLHSSQTASVESRASSDLSALDHMDTALSLDSLMSKLPCAWASLLAKMKQLEDMDREEESLSQRIDVHARRFIQARQQKLQHDDTHNGKLQVSRTLTKSQIPISVTRKANTATATGSHNTNTSKAGNQHTSFTFHGIPAVKQEPRSLSATTATNVRPLNGGLPHHKSNLSAHSMPSAPSSSSSAVMGKDIVLKVRPNSDQGLRVTNITTATGNSDQPANIKQIPKAKHYKTLSKKLKFNKKAW